MYNVSSPPGQLSDAITSKSAEFDAKAHNKPLPPRSGGEGAGKSDTVYDTFLQQASFKPGISRKEIWRSLPVASKIYLVLLVVDVAVAFLALAHQLQQDCQLPSCHVEEVQALVVTVIALCSFAWTTCDAILCENGFQLLLSAPTMLLAGLGLTSTTLSWDSPDNLRSTSSYQAATAFVPFIIIAHIWLAYLTWHQFGWRTHSRFGSDLRCKHSALRLRMQQLSNRFCALSKADAQMLLLVSASGVVLATGGTHHNRSTGVLVCCFLGVALQAAWLWAARVAVCDCNQSLESLVTVTVGGLCFWPLILGYLVLLGHWPVSPGGQAALLVPLAAWLALRLALWWHMRALMAALQRPEVVAALRSGRWAGQDDAGRDLPLELAPLLRGAWLRKRSHAAEPSPSSALQRCASALCPGDKQRFFQLSSDLTTLRWSWDKYVLLFYVEQLEADDRALTIRLGFSLEPDLLLAWEDRATYEQWKAGLQLLMNMLMAPGPKVAGGRKSGRPAGALPAAAGMLAAQQSLVKHALGTPGSSSRSSMLHKLGGSSRFSTGDPKCHKLHKAQDWAAHSLAAAALHLGHLPPTTLATGKDTIRSTVDRAMGLGDKAHDGGSIFASDGNSLLRRQQLRALHLAASSSLGTTESLGSAASSLRTLESLGTLDSVDLEADDSSGPSSPVRQVFHLGGSNLRPQVLLTPGGLVGHDVFVKLSSTPAAAPQQQLPEVAEGQGEQVEAPSISHGPQAAPPTTPQAAPAQAGSPSPGSSDGKPTTSSFVSMPLDGHQPGGGSSNARPGSELQLPGRESTISIGDCVSGSLTGCIGTAAKGLAASPSAHARATGQESAARSAAAVQLQQQQFYQQRMCQLQEKCHFAFSTKSSSMRGRVSEEGRAIVVAEAVTVEPGKAERPACAPLLQQEVAAEQQQVAALSPPEEAAAVGIPVFPPPVQQQAAPAQPQQPAVAAELAKLESPRQQATISTASSDIGSMLLLCSSTLASDDDTPAQHPPGTMSAMPQQQQQQQQDQEEEPYTPPRSTLLDRYAEPQPQHSAPCTTPLYALHDCDSPVTLHPSQPASPHPPLQDVQLEEEPYTPPRSTLLDRYAQQHPTETAQVYTPPRSTLLDRYATPAPLPQPQQPGQTEEQPCTPPWSTLLDPCTNSTPDPEPQQAEPQPYTPPRSTLLDRYARPQSPEPQQDSSIPQNPPAKPHPSPASSYYSSKLQVITDTGSPPATATIAAVWSPPAGSPADSPTSSTTSVTSAWSPRRLLTLLSGSSAGSAGGSPSRASSPAGGGMRSQWGSFTSAGSAQMLPLQQQLSSTSTWSHFTAESFGNSMVLPGRRGISAQVSIELVEHAELTMGKFLGSGAEGAVYAAWYQETPVAVKKTNSASEVQMNLAVGLHDNVVALRALCQHEGSWHLVMEYCPRGTLDVMLRHTSPANKWDASKVLQILRSVARGMLHLHTRRPPVLHRDLKPANIFVGHGLVMKIGDFGMSRNVQLGPPPPAAPSLATTPASNNSISRTLTAGVVGTVAYAAPEVLDESLQQPDAPGERLLKADVYSFGVTVWEVLERKRPHEGMDAFQMSALWICNPEAMALPRVTVPESAAPCERAVIQGLAELAVECTRFNPDDRPDFREVLRRLKVLQQAAVGGDGGAKPAEGEVMV